MRGLLRPGASSLPQRACSERPFDELIVKGREADRDSACQAQNTGVELALQMVSQVFTPLL
jgi:hypothetical protein